MPYINYLLFVLKNGYREFEERIAHTAAPRGTKTEQVLRAINGFSGDFTLRQLELHCPGVSCDTIRLVLKKNARAGFITCNGRGAGSRWTRLRVIPFYEGSDEGNEP